MKIYTYFEDISFKAQDPLLGLWEKSWKMQGLEPVILGKEDAKIHPDFDWFDEQMKELHKIICKKEIMDYGMTCYYRWLAYAALDHSEDFYVSDYDIINLGVNQETLSKVTFKNCLHFMDHACPCFAHGNTQLFNNLVFDMVNMSQINIERLKSKKIKPWYHDQEFVQHNLATLKDMQQYIKGYRLTRNRPLIAAWPGSAQDNIGKIIHFSHHGTAALKKSWKSREDLNWMRVGLIERSLALLEDSQ